MKKLKIPLKESEVRKLKVGDEIELSGILFTARDTAHKYLVEKPSEFKELNVIYHCGPIAKKYGSWNIISAGPTTSIREEPYMAKVIRDFKVRAIIGKGGMGSKTSEALKKYGCVYLSAVGGLGALLAKHIKKVVNVYKLEFGIPEAIWELEVKDFPVIVTMDAKGNSLYKDVFSKSKKNYDLLLK